MNVSVILSDSSCKDGNAAETVFLKVLYEKYELNFDVYNFNFWLVLCLVNLKLKRQYLPQLIRYKSYEYCCDSDIFVWRVTWNYTLVGRGGRDLNSSTGNYRHPNVFCGKRASQLVISLKLKSFICRIQMFVLENASFDLFKIVE